MTAGELIEALSLYDKDYEVNGKKNTIGGYDVYEKVNKGDVIIIREYFYPMHYTEFMGVKR